MLEQGSKVRSRVERRLWTPNATAFGGRASRRRFYYEAFLPDPIAELDLQLPSDVATVVTHAETEVRALNERAPDLGALEVLARQLLRAEAVASSRIEGLEMSHRRLARAEFAPEVADRSARTVVGNVRAMERAVELGASTRRFGVGDVLKLHEALLRETDATIAGRFRTKQSWIGGREDTPLGAKFIPPPEDRVRPLLVNLCEFIQREDVPAIAQAAVAHSQFETIHPFADGNGRVGRCLIHVVLRRRGLAPRYIPPVSLVLATDQRSYVRGLTTYREYTTHAVASWIGLFAQAVRRSAQEAEGFAERIAQLQAEWRRRANVQRRGSAADRLITHLPAEPVLDIPRASRILEVVYEAARLAVEQLVRARILFPVTARKHGRLYEARELFDLIDSFERELATPRGERRRARVAPRARPPRSAAAR